MPPVELLQNLWAGKDSSDYGNGLSLMGELSDVNAWARPAREKFMREWTTCQIMGTGDPINWETSQWTVVGMNKR